MRWTSNSASAALDAIFISDRGQLLFLIPFIDIGRTEIIAIFGHTLQASIPILNNQVGLVITFVSDCKQLLRYTDLTLTHPFIALHPLIPRRTIFIGPPAASLMIFIAFFCFSAFVAPSIKNI